MKKLDLYIIKKFLGTFILSILLIILIVIVFDISEKLEDFISHHAPLKAIIFEYYLNFVPYFVNLFSPLFTFISVIFFTSKMAGNTEIVAILSSGISFKRFLFPYLIASALIATLSLYLNFYIIPRANKKRLDFEEKYIRVRFQFTGQNTHLQDSENTYVFFESFNTYDKIGYNFTLEKFKNNSLYYKIGADFIKWDSLKNQWHLDNYWTRQIDGLNEKLNYLTNLDTSLNITPNDFTKRTNIIQALDINELDKFIEQEKLRGSDLIPFYLVEKYQRSSMPFATFVLTIIGVALSSRKVRGGIGMHIGFGLAIAFSYLMFIQIFTTFAYYAGFSPFASVWLPNVIYLFISIVLLRLAPK